MKKNKFDISLNNLSWEKEHFKECDKENCSEKGEFKAPKSRLELNNYYYFCIEHIKEYNKSLLTEYLYLSLKKVIHSVSKNFW